MTVRSRADNEAVASALDGERLATIRYRLLNVTSDWDFGVWHEPTMGIELATASGDRYSAIWNAYDEWGHGVDLHATPLREHVADDIAELWLDVSDSPAWLPLLRTPVQAAFDWDDFGTGRAPMPTSLRISTSHAAAWIIAAEHEYQQFKLSFHLGLDSLIVVFNERFADALGVFDHESGRDLAAW